MWLLTRLISGAILGFIGLALGLPESAVLVICFIIGVMTADSGNQSCRACSSDCESDYEEDNYPEEHYPEEISI